MKPTALAFLAALLAAFYGAHFLIYRSLIRFLGITDPMPRKALFWLLILLCLLVIFAFPLARSWMHPVADALYLAGAVWLALFLHLLLASLLAWMICLPLEARPGLVRAAALTLFGIAGLWTAYGFWNAQHPRVKRLDIPVAHVKPGSEGSTLVHLSDLHLGRIHGTRFMEQLIVKIAALQPDAILITGDLFDGLSGELSGFTALLRKLKAPRGVYFVTGNHEYYAGHSRVMKVLAQSGIRVLNNEAVDAGGLGLIGVSYPGLLGEKANPGIRGYAEIASREIPRILLFHTPTSIRLGNGERHVSLYLSPDTSFGANGALKIDLQLSGHTHRGQIFPFNFLTRILYRGYDYGLHRMEDFHLYVSPGVGTWGPPMRTVGPPEIVVIRLLEKK